MNSFRPDGEFLKKANLSYVDRIKEYNSPELIKSHIEHGLLVESSVENDLERTSVSGLKDILVTKELSTSGKKSVLIARTIENFSESELKELLLNSRYVLTSDGIAAVASWEEDQRTYRLTRASALVDLIATKKFNEAAEKIRPKGAISSGSDYIPEGLALYFSECGITDKRFMTAIVEDVVMGYRPPTVIADAESQGLILEESVLQRGMVGGHAYAAALMACKLVGKYIINASTCPCCKKMDGKTFTLKEAKIGTSLPPFSDNCTSYVETPKK